MRRVLIIKTGFSEFLDLGISTTVSLGDVLICTSVLPAFRHDQVTWLTDYQAKPLLEKNPYINELVIFQTSAMEALKQRAFDVVLNLEKDFSLCLLTNQIKAPKKLGFYYDDRSHAIATRKRSTQYLLSGQENQRGINKNAFELLYEAIGQPWKGQGVVLGITPRKKCQFDIGFNYAVGSKWPTKAWPERYWKILEQLLAKDFKISWQQGHKNLNRYVDWINNCRMIITNDSLGQAIAQGLNKDVITLYGPTNPNRMGGIKNVHLLMPTLACPHMPCFMPVCKNDKFCMDYISPERVANKVREIWK